MTCAPWAAASRTAASWTWIIDSLSPVQAVWKRAARITRLIFGLHSLGVALGVR